MLRDRPLTAIRGAPRLSGDRATFRIQDTRPKRGETSNRRSDRQARDGRSSSMHHLIPLALLEPGRPARIDQVLGPEAEVHRLHELGLAAGAEIEVLNPGNPCIVRLVGHTLCFRPDELTQVLVRLEDAP